MSNRPDMAMIKYMDYDLNNTQANSTIRCEEEQSYKHRYKIERTWTHCNQ